VVPQIVKAQASSRACDLAHIRSACCVAANRRGVLQLSADWTVHGPCQASPRGKPATYWPRRIGLGIPFRTRKDVPVRLQITAEKHLSAFSEPHDRVMGMRIEKDHALTSTSL